MSAGAQLAMTEALEKQAQEKYTPHVVSHGYMASTLDPVELKAKTDQAIEMLRPIAHTFDAIAFRGMSGAILAPIIAVALGKSLILVRKPNDGSHSQQNASWGPTQFTDSHGNTRKLTNLVEGDVAARRYIIVDDFQSEGKTARAIRDEVRKVNPEAVCLGVCAVSKLYPGKPALQAIKFDRPTPVPNEYLNKFVYDGTKFDVVKGT